MTDLLVRNARLVAAMDAQRTEIAGGWVAVTGCGDCVVEAHAPEGVEISQREPLMPYEAKWTGVKYRGFPGWHLGRC